MTINLIYEQTPEFKKDFKKLKKRLRTLHEDFNLVKKTTIELLYLQNTDNRSIFPIPELCSQKVDICKIKKFACKSLFGKGSRSGLRVIYAFLKSNSKIIFIEIYYKGNKPNEDRNRIKNFLKNL
ncbi:hypothetical protein A3J22_03105 [Candidatus Beckwithbacteria bacterium RIFCSPLOWO2_02_FULL_49_12]|nr:MAG: hypothetical protein UY43_C0001G0249 [Candidatus Beckwithbacteria bacterium GW2011_GWC1_49_16]KKW02933.1 MAG: hypothetical protein UY37_C0009G0007 [Candidatus Beckwithbacteria bacterium GW2011_GWC2_49_11]OGD48637.1 MAG: hypothetical protein A2877_02750 [Candidatus Beckwithbacteria bacterium RIFCSPHIGHO2_01_FULL_49_39]OGD58730.1 MAG: hypothetical protein A3J22_03105 [Candidatus Beckwithbacteria bacterium RIFCSPLOWO2_02_FULL_49_12]HCM44946.1 hypothetical protein [Candidatus Beckwithbacter